MRSVIDNICTLHYSPYILAPLLEHFYEGITPRQNNVLLAYILFPLLLTPKSMTKFRNANRTSTLHTLTADSKILSGIEERISEMKDKTNHSLLLLFKTKSLRLDDDMSVTFLAKKLDSSACTSDQVRAARNFGMVLNQYDVPTCYRILGVREL